VPGPLRLTALSVCVLAAVLPGCGSASTANAPRPSTEPLAVATGVLLAGRATTISIEPPPAVRRAGGRRLEQFTAGRTVVARSGCLACHRIGTQGHRSPGPDLTGVGNRLPARAIEQTLINPVAPMPSFKHLPRKKLAAVAAFLSALHTEPSAPCNRCLK
jgi:mono/diheme cytochrome c family protein